MASWLVLAALLTVVKSQWNPSLVDIYEIVPKFNENLVLDVDNANHIAVTTRTGYKTTQIFQFKLNPRRNRYLRNKNYYIVDIEFLETLQLNNADEGKLIRATINNNLKDQEWYILNLPHEPEFHRIQNREYYQRCLTVNNHSIVFWSDCEDNNDAQLFKIKNLSNSVLSLPVVYLPSEHTESAELLYNDISDFPSFNNESLRRAYDVCTQQFPESIENLLALKECNYITGNY